MTNYPIHNLAKQLRLALWGTIAMLVALSTAGDGAAQYSSSFQSNQSNKLLVLIDGRSVYTPLFSGVFWDAQNVMLEDGDRIKVIRGPGGTLWGANAVNGVINVMTKSARDTQSALLSRGGGSYLTGFGNALT